MTLTLLAVSLNERPLSQPITAHFDASGGTIGRADHNTMALPDPERHVSRLQAEIVCQSGGNFLIRNVGAANPIVVAGRVVGRSETAPLVHGDEVRIGGYLLQVDCSAPEAALEITRGRALRNAVQAPALPASAPLPASASASASPPVSPPVSAPVSAPASGFARGPAADPASGGNPFADLLTPVSAAGKPTARVRGTAAATEDPFADLMPPPAGVPAASAGLARAPAPPQARLPDDFDPFAPPAAPSLEASAPASATDPFADLMPSGPPPSIDAWLGNKEGNDDPLAHFMERPLVASGTAARERPGAGPDPAGGFGHGPGDGAGDGDGAGESNGVPTDPMQALFGDAPRPAHPAPQSDHVPALQGAFRGARPAAAAPRYEPAPPEQTPVPPHWPSPAPSPRPAPAPLARPPAPARSADALQADRAWSAFCSGAGIAVPPHPNGSEEGLREVGRVLRSAVEGALRLMAVRANTKHELRAAVTVIQSRGNNPLKFSPDATAALEVLLQPGARGFLSGTAAMDDAMHDLVGHSIGTLAGMRAAIDGMLDRFAPDELEAKLAGRSMLDNVLPSHRKARLWDLYVQHHDAIREEAQEDFHTLFGKAFLAAYEQQIARLRRRQPGTTEAAPDGALRDPSAPGAGHEPPDLDDR